MADVDVFLLAAGFGTRLQPHTATTPKPLIKVGGKSLLQWNLERLTRENFRKAFINVHYLGDQIVQFIQSRDWGLELVIIEEREQILDTGGAIANISSMINAENLLIINTDSLFGSDFSLRSLVDVHLANPDHPLVTMVLRKDNRASDYGLVGIDKNGQVLSLRGEAYFDGHVSENLMFAGNSIISRRLFQFMPEDRAVFSLTRDTFKKVLSEHGIIWGYKYEGYWNDVGTIEDLRLAEKAFEQGLLT